MTKSDNLKPADSEAPEPQPDGENRTDPAERSDGASKSGESGGPKGLEPTRYGDWERNGRCTDF